MQKLSILLSLFVSVLCANGQGCVNIESILVDACTLASGCNSSTAPTCNCEGMNEMLRFSVGNNDLEVGDLVVNWPNNGFQGICQNAQTAQNTNDLNETIESCGWLTEPQNDVLPANSQVLVVTSADMCIASNSFANLSDTLIIIYQCPGNFNGHFANYGAGFRTTTISFGGGCTSTASYNRALLVTQAGGNAAEDGATVDFPSTGSPVYYNEGCNAPVPTEIVDAGEDIEACPGEAFELNGFLQGDFTNWYWSGGSGSFDTAGDLNATYTPGSDEGPEYTLTLNAVNCNGIVTDDIAITILEDEVPVITPAGPLEICPDETIELTATGSGEITWSTGEVGPTLIVSEPGTYSATLSGACSESEASVEVTASSDASLSILPSNNVSVCPDESVELIALGDGDFLWSDGSTTSSITVSTPGEYSVELTNSCGVSEETITVSLLDLPELSLITPEEVLLCEGDSVILEADGIGSFEWSTGETTSAIIVSELGSYSVTLSNACGTDTGTIEVLDGGNLPEAAIDVLGSSTFCAGESVVLMADSDSDFIWSNGATEDEIEVYLPGTYTLTATNDCGSTSAEVVVTQVNQPSVSVAMDTVAICHGEPVELSALSTLPVTWSTGSTGSSIAVNEPGLYHAAVSNACGSDTAFVQVLSGDPLADFTATPDTGSAPLEVFFLNSSSDAHLFNWYVNDVSVGTDEDLNHYFNSPGNYEVLLTATDSAGCSDSYSIEYLVGGCDEARLFIPNTFTPNGDGTNDLFRFVAGCVEAYEMQIFNRWGVLLYTGQKGDPFWDGNNGHGSYVADGVYVYTIRYKATNGMWKEKNGTITIFR